MNKKINFVNEIPPKLQRCPNAIYFLKAGSSVETYVTDFNSDIFPLEASDNDLLYTNTALLPNTQGGYFQGEPATPSEGLTVQEAFDKLLFPATQPTISFNVNSDIIERGSNYSKTININFNQNDAGPLLSYSLEKNGIEVSSTQITNFVADNVTSDFTLQAKVNHDSSSQLIANTVATDIRNISQKLKIWYGALASLPTASAQVRAITNNVWDTQNEIILDTGTTNNYFVVVVPTSVNNSASLLAQDVTNNVNYNYNFVNTVDVILPNGNLQEYRVYSLELDNAYSSNAEHVIQI